MMGEPPQKVVRTAIIHQAWNRSSGVTVLTIWGIRVFFHMTAQGVFYCQRCRGDRRYRRRSGRRFFTLFFVPVIPLNTVGEHVVCTTCRTRYHPDVLALPRPSQQGAGAG